MPKREIKLVYLFVLLWVAFIAGCAPKTKQRVLSFFFDGVPFVAADSLSQSAKTNINDTTENIVEEKTTAIITGSVHQPYQEGSCAACHNQQEIGLYSAPMPALCYTCHEDFSKKFAFVHGPVAAGYCTSCHLPHYSDFPKLLMRIGQNLCLDCHDKNALIATETHSGIGEMGCTDCHLPHGGKDKYFLNYFENTDH